MIPPLYLVVSPAEEPVTVDEAKEALRLDLGSIEDSFLEARIATARSLLSGPEGYTKRQLVTASWRMDLPYFPSGRSPVVIPLPPLRDVTKVEYVDGDGAVQTWSSSLYQVVKPIATAEGFYAEDVERGQILPVYGGEYPDTREQPDAVRVTFACGYGPAGMVPYIFRTAILLVVGELYKNREETSTAALQDVPLAARNLLWGLRDRDRWDITRDRASRAECA